MNSACSACQSAKLRIAVGSVSTLGFTRANGSITSLSRRTMRSPSRSIAGIADMVRRASPPKANGRVPGVAPPPAGPSRASLMRAEISSPERVWSWLIA